jgi:hypothetical protein
VAPFIATLTPLCYVKALMKKLAALMFAGLLMVILQGCADERGPDTHASFNETPPTLDNSTRSAFPATPEGNPNY